MSRLDVFREARLADARGSAGEILADAEARAAGILEEARRSAAAQEASARADGSAGADRELAIVEARERRRARGRVLAARRASFEELRARVLAGLDSLRERPEYPALLDRLESAARAQLGADARIQRDPPATGGVVADEGGRRVDYTLPALAARCLDEAGEEVEQLWA